MSDFPIVEEYEQDGLRAIVAYVECLDENDDPRQNTDCNVGVIVCGHDRYTLGDEQLDRDFDGFKVECHKCEGVGTRKFGFHERECETCEGYGEVAVDPVTYFKREHGATVVLPLYLYDHSGITMRAGSPGEGNPFSCQWDSGIVGWIYNDPEQEAKVGAPTDPVAVEKGLRAEVDEYDAYLRGEVYSWRVEDENGDMLDSCYGFVGECGRKYAMECAKEVLEDELEDRRKEAEQVAYWRDRGVETV